MQSLGGHTKDAGLYPKGKGYEQGKDMTRLVFQLLRAEYTAGTRQWEKEAALGCKGSVLGVLSAVSRGAQLLASYPRSHYRNLGLGKQ